MVRTECLSVLSKTDGRVAELARLALSIFAIYCFFIYIYIYIFFATGCANVYLSGGEDYQ